MSHLRGRKSETFCPARRSHRSAHAPSVPSSLVPFCPERLRAPHIATSPPALAKPMSHVPCPLAGGDIWGHYGTFVMRLLTSPRCQVPPVASSMFAKNVPKRFKRSTPVPTATGVALLADFGTKNGTPKSAIYLIIAIDSPALPRPPGPSHAVRVLAREIVCRAPVPKEPPCARIFVCPMCQLEADGGPCLRLRCNSCRMIRDASPIVCRGIRNADDGTTRITGQP
jgi:hypothetical protein